MFVGYFELPDMSPLRTESRPGSSFLPVIADLCFFAAARYDSHANHQSLTQEDHVCLSHDPTGTLSWY